MIVLHTLGDTLILVGDRKVRPSSPLVFASLLYLAMERGRRVPRAALQEMLFPDSDERSGSHSLRQLLYKLRQLGAPLESDATSVALPADCVRDDTSPNGGAHPATVKFLPDYEPEISEGFSEWLEVKRAEIAKDVRMKLASAIEAHREALNWSAVERDAQLLLSVDPFNEVGTFALAEAAALSGRKAAAIKILSDYEKETGRTDLRLPASLLRRRIVQAVPEPVATLSALPFVGRDAEVKELRKYIARARAGQPCMYVIGGEAGIGKTRLLTETAALAALEGVSVFTVRCQAHYASRPLSVFIELVPALLAAPGALGVSPQSLASLNSLTSHTDVESERPPDSRDDVTRAELLLAAIRDLFDAVSSEQPLLIAIEDAHWADNDSLRALNRLVQGVSNRSLLVTCTTRTPETFPYSIATDDQCVLRRLKPLSTTAMGELADRLLSKQRNGIGESLVEWSVRTSGGNPLFLQMLCSHYTSTGEAFVIPPDVLSAVTRRVEQLPEQCRRILVLCALLSKHATVDLLRELTGWTLLELLDAFQRLEGDGFVTLDNDALRVAHDLVCQAAVSLATPISKRVVHACVATALEKRYELTNDSSLLWDCAVQWEQSGNSRKAVEYITRCARHASRIGRASEALKLLARAEELARYPDEHISVLRESVVTARAARQWQATAAFAKTLNKLQPNAREHSSYELASHQALWWGRFAGNESITQLFRCATAADASVAHRIEAGHLLVCIAHETGNVELGARAYEHVKDLIDLSVGTTSNLTLAPIYEVCLGNRFRGQELVNTLLGRSQHFDSVADELRTGLVACGALVMLGDTLSAAAVATRHYQRSLELDVPAWQTEFATHTSTIYCIQEDVEAAEQWLRIVDEETLLQVQACALRHLANKIEIAILKNDGQTAAELLAGSNIASLGDSLRGRAYFKSLEIRHKQLEESFQADDTMLDELRMLHMKTKRLSCADGLTLAYAEALRRRGLLSELQSVLESYLSDDRREIGPLAPSLQRLVGRLAIRNSDESPTQSTFVGAGGDELEERQIAAQR